MSRIGCGIASMHMYIEELKWEVCVYMNILDIYAMIGPLFKQLDPLTLAPSGALLFVLLGRPWRLTSVNHPVELDWFPVP